MMVLVIDDAELSWCNTVDSLLGMYDKFMIARPCQCSWMILRRMANLKCHLTRCQALCEKMEIVHREILLIGRLRVIAMRNVKNILRHVLLHHKPGTATETHTLALTYSVEP